MHKRENENSISPESDFNVKMWCYRLQIEKEVQILQKQLEEEIDLHAALSNAVEDNTLPLSGFPSKLPNEAQELLASIDSLEVVVAKLEEELLTLQFCLHHERSERYFTESLLKRMSMPSLEAPLLTSGYMWEEHVTSLTVSKLGGHVPPSLHYDILPVGGDLESVIRPAEISPINEALNLSNGEENEKRTCTPLGETFTELDNITVESLWKHPNHLSEEMLLCMRNIFLCLSGSSVLSARTSLSDSLSSASSPVGSLSHSSLTSFSDSFRLPSLMRGSSEELIDSSEATCQEKLYDPYGVNKRVNWKDIGKYGFTTNISWMTVGKMQLEYAAKALKKFRLLVEQLAKGEPNSNE
ncbi:hypothetical protein HPP92_027042 [Vanilla planifolia]|uniref:Ternary complex factor MIP1 leucine-zipper domain-containing protein n=1 Tax=Vanilla planifolia TaxID=51239 RepID=A0A835U536_VANPL|nr:hypothetical protein HPP92_027042 [Vanilla planifolia]